MVLNLSCPAVSHICSFTRFPSSSIVLILKSMPMVVMKEGVKESSLKRRRQHDLPTPESPINSSLICGCLVSLSTPTRSLLSGSLPGSRNYASRPSRSRSRVSWEYRRVREGVRRDMDGYGLGEV